MIRYLVCLLLMVNAAQEAHAQSQPADEQSIRSVVVHFFDALAELDTAKAKNNCTDDVTILESGKVWNLDSLALRMTTRKAKSSDFKRINTFDFIDTHVDGNLGYVSYFNHASITFNGKTVEVKWLETAVMKKHEMQWKMALLHSTEIERTR